MRLNRQATPCFVGGVKYAWCRTVAEKSVHPGPEGCSITDRFDVAVLPPFHLHGPKFPMREQKYEGLLALTGLTTRALSTVAGLVELCFGAFCCRHERKGPRG